MNVLVYRDGKLVCTDNPIQGTGNALDNLLMLVSEPQDGDVIKYDAANGIWVAGAESGGGGSGGGFLKLNLSDETGALDKTWKEILDALEAGYYVSIVNKYGQNECLQIQIIFAVKDGDDYKVEDRNGTPYVTDSENGYPVDQS